MAKRIPTEELHRTEAKCTALLGLQEDYRHVIRDLEQNYGASVREQPVRRIVGGGAGPEEILLEEEPADHLA
jgi:hypothetical protein